MQDTAPILILILSYLQFRTGTSPTQMNKKSYQNVTNVSLLEATRRAIQHEFLRLSRRQASDSEKMKNNQEEFKPML